MRMPSIALAAAFAANLCTAPVSAATGHYTYHFDNGRTGWNRFETALTTSTVAGGHFGLVRTLAADSVVYAQPLYAPGIAVNGVKHNLVIIASENDSVYAYDADTGRAVWQRRFTNPSAGITAVSTGSVGGCNQITPTIGISSTPVIDPSTGTLYLVDKIQITKGNATSYQFQVRALDLRSGLDRTAYQQVAATVKLGDGSTTTFTPQVQQNRVGLLFANGAVYVGFGSSCDGDGNTSHGWVFAFSGSTLKPMAVLNTATSSSSSSLGAVWQSTFGLAADTSGNLFFNTGNGSFDADSGGSDYGESVLRANPNLTVGDYFSPSNESQLSDDDQDMGSNGVMIIPNIPNSSAHLAISGEKTGTMYLLNRDNMGRFNSSSDRALQEIALADSGNALYGGAAYYNGTVYWGASGQPMEAFALSLSPTPRLTLRSHTSTTFDGGGEIPAVSSNGNAAGSAVVWATSRPGNGGTIALYAYDARDISKLLYSGAVGTWQAAATPFLSPAIADGHVFVPGAGYGVAEFGLH
jgi:hypothetical protein